MAMMPIAAAAPQGAQNAAGVPMNVQPKEEEQFMELIFPGKDKGYSILLVSYMENPQIII
jgi:hypothetical protein